MARGVVVLGGETEHGVHAVVVDRAVALDLKMDLVIARRVVGRRDWTGDGQNERESGDDQADEPWHGVFLAAMGTVRL